MKVTTVERTAIRQLTEEEVQRYLPLYKPDCVSIEQARYEPGCLWARFRHYGLGYHQKPLSHLSRVQIVHYLGQAAYVLGGCLARDGRFAPSTVEDYRQRVLEERCTFRQLKLKFRNYIPNQAGTTIRLKCTSVRRFREHFLVHLKFELNDGDCFGEAHAILISASGSE